MGRITRVAERDLHGDQVALYVEVRHPERVAVQVGARSGDASERRDWTADARCLERDLQRPVSRHGDQDHHSQRGGGGDISEKTPPHQRFRSWRGPYSTASASRSACSTAGAVMNRTSSSQPIASYALTRSFASLAVLIVPCHTRG